ncbi:MAG: ribonuclease P protein component [Desulfovibrio sp.]|nr:ribonuclease P protein component [Desulfovibrio sp.]
MRFSSEHRLKKRPDFVRCYEHGRRFFSDNFVLFVRRRSDGVLPWRLGIAVTKKTGVAIRRNRVRRLIRECFRLAQQRVPAGYDYVVVPKRCLVPQTATLMTVNAELIPLLCAVVSRNTRTF